MNQQTDYLIQVNNLSFSYLDSNNLVLDNISLNIKKGDFVGIIGKNGSGKSTLLKLILGILKSHTGNIVLKKDKSIGYVEQVTSTTENFIPASVQEIVLLGLCKNVGLFKFFNKTHKQMALSALHMVGLEGYENRLISNLSGGQQQKAIVAKALISNPDILILDEPTTGIDSEGEKEFLNLLKHLNKEHGKTIILVTHNFERLTFANRIFKVENKTVKEATNV